MYPIRVTSVSNRRELARFIQMKIPSSQYDDPFIKCKVSINVITKVIAEYIWDYGIIRKIKSYVRKSEVFNKEDKRVIFEKVIDIASCLRKDPDIVEENLLYYFKTSKTISVDGFIDFRLCNLMYRIKALADMCATEYFAEKEYEEYIALLKYFVSQQKSEYKEVHIVTGDNGEHRIINNDGKDITLQCLDGFVDSQMATDASLDDLLVSTLISVAPSRIIMHNEYKSNNPELVETIKGIFAARIIVSNT